MTDPVVIGGALMVAALLIIGVWGVFSKESADG